MHAEIVHRAAQAQSIVALWLPCHTPLCGSVPLINFKFSVADWQLQLSAVPCNVRPYFHPLALSVFEDAVMDKPARGNLLRGDEIVLYPGTLHKSLLQLSLTSLPRHYISIYSAPPRSLAIICRIIGDTT